MAGTLYAYRRAGELREAGGDGFANETGGYPPGWIEAASDDERAAAQAYALAIPDAPAGVLVLGRVLVDDPEGPRVELEVRDFTLAELKAQALAEADAEYEARRTSPMPWDFGAVEALTDLGVSVGAAGPQTLQMRERPRDDMKNWLALAAGASAAVGAGASGALLPLKTTGNVWVQTTAVQVLQVLVAGDGAQLSALQRGAAQLARYGELKGLIAAAEDAAELAAVRGEISEDWQE